MRALRAAGLALAAATAVAVIAAAGTWRLALLAALAAAAVALMQLRYAPIAGIALLALVAALAAGGKSAGADQRATAHLKADHAERHVDDRIWPRVSRRSRTRARRAGRALAAP